MYAVKISDRDGWFELWFSDKKSVLETMISNMAADLNAGYDYFGNSITKQREEIENYKKEFDAQVMEFAKMTIKQVEKWCFYDMKRRGAIE